MFAHSKVVAPTSVRVRAVAPKQVPSESPRKVIKRVVPKESTTLKTTTVAKSPFAPSKAGNVGARAPVSSSVTQSEPNVNFSRPLAASQRKSNVVVVAAGLPKPERTVVAVPAKKVDAVVPPRSPRVPVEPVAQVVATRRVSSLTRTTRLNVADLECDLSFDDSVDLLESTPSFKAFAEGSNSLKRSSSRSNDLMASTPSWEKFTGGVPASGSSKLFCTKPLMTRSGSSTLTVPSISLEDIDLMASTPSWEAFSSMKRTTKLPAKLPSFDVLAESTSEAEDLMASTPSWEAFSSMKRTTKLPERLPSFDVLANSNSEAEDLMASTPSWEAFQHPRLTVAEPRRCVTPTITVTDCDGDDSTGTCIVHSEESIDAVLALEEEEAEAARQNRSVADMRAEAEARRTGAYWMVF